MSLYVLAVIGDVGPQVVSLSPSLAVPVSTNRILRVLRSCSCQVRSYCDSDNRPDAVSRENATPPGPRLGRAILAEPLGTPNTVPVVRKQDLEARPAVEQGRQQC
jgi:hypothetical protein